jgi:prolyl-tRNA synthetase
VERIGPGGFLGPVGAHVPILLDKGVAPGPYVVGGNRPDVHVRGVEPGRDFPFESVDVRTVEPGDTVDGQVIRIEPAIEVGNIFKLGTRYSEPLGATYLDEQGREQLIWMGSYGIGPARIAAAAVEQFADEHGISWPRSIAPFDAELVGLGRPGSEEHELAERLYEELREAGLDVLYDDRDEGPGAKFADAELLGVPLRLTVGRRTLAAGELEAQVRRGREQRGIPLEGAAGAAADLWRSLP